MTLPPQLESWLHKQAGLPSLHSKEHLLYCRKSAPTGPAVGLLASRAISGFRLLCSVALACSMSPGTGLLTLSLPPACVRTPKNLDFFMIIIIFHRRFNIRPNNSRRDRLCWLASSSTTAFGRCYCDAPGRALVAQCVLANADRTTQQVTHKRFTYMYESHASTDDCRSKHDETCMLLRPAILQTTHIHTLHSL